MPKYHTNQRAIEHGSKRLARVAFRSVRQAPLSESPQDGGCKWSTPGALPPATTFKCKFVAQMTSLSSSEQLAGAPSAAHGSAAAEKEAATGEPSSGRHNNKLDGEETRSNSDGAGCPRPAPSF